MLTLTPLRQPSGTHITGKCLRLFYAHVWLQHHMCQVIGNAASTFPLEAPMEGHADLMHNSSLDMQWSYTPRHHSTRFDLSTRRANKHPLSMLDLAFRRQFGAEFGKECWLEGIEPWHPSCHWPTDVMLGQSIGRNHDRIVLITYGGETIIGAVSEVLRGRITLLVVQGIVYRRFRGLIVGG